MKTISAIIALLLFSLIVYSNLGCNKSTDLTSPSSSPPPITDYTTTINISGIIMDVNGNPIDTASVELWCYNLEGMRSRLVYTKTNERGEYSFNKKFTVKSAGVPKLEIYAVDYTINDSGKIERWYNEADSIEMKESPQVINLVLSILDIGINMWTPPFLFIPKDS